MLFEGEGKLIINGSILAARHALTIWLHEIAFDGLGEVAAVAAVVVVLKFEIAVSEAWQGFLNSDFLSLFVFVIF